jgi:hypothetical protein
LKSLESGEYAQTKGQLWRHTENGKDSYCCLGLACVVAKNHGVDISFNADSFRSIGPYIQGETALLPKKVQLWMGMKSNNGCYLYRGLQGSSLALRNDNGLSFKEIAKLIRKHADQLFTQEALSRAVKKENNNG